MRGGRWLAALWLVVVTGAAVAAPPARTAPSSPGELVRELTRDPDGDLSVLARAFFGKSGGNQLFYFPTADPRDTPATWGVGYEDVWFNSKDGTKLHGWFLPSKQKPALGTVVFSHGNAGAIGHHLGFVTWLLPEGFNVFLYDYRGFGSSGGTIQRHGLIEDVRAAFDYVRSRPDVDRTRLISMGHSLGGAKSITALAEQPVPGVRAVISDSGFASYRGMADVIAGKVGRNIVTDEWAPKDWVARISPLPLLFIHGTADEVVPFAQGKQLFAAAAMPKTLFTVQGGGHGDSLWRNNGEYRARLVEWLKPKLR